MSGKKMLGQRVAPGSCRAWDRTHILMGEWKQASRQGAWQEKTQTQALSPQLARLCFILNFPRATQTADKNTALRGPACGTDPSRGAKAGAGSAKPFPNMYC